MGVPPKWEGLYPLGAGGEQPGQSGGRGRPVLCPQTRVHHRQRWQGGGRRRDSGGARKGTWCLRASLCLPGAATMPCLLVTDGRSLWGSPSPAGFTFLGPTTQGLVCLSLSPPTGPEGALHQPGPRPQGWGHPPHPARLQPADRAAGGHPSGRWRPALLPVRATFSFHRHHVLWGGGCWGEQGRAQSNPAQAARLLEARPSGCSLGPRCGPYSQHGRATSRGQVGPGAWGDPCTSPLLPS